MAQEPDAMTPYHQQDGATPSPECVKVYRTARDVLQCAKSWHADVRLLGNVTANDISQLCEFLIRSVESSHLIRLPDVPIPFWVCPHGCAGGVMHTNGVAVCQCCGESSETSG